MGVPPRLLLPGEQVVVVTRPSGKELAGELVSAFVLAGVAAALAGAVSSGPGGGVLRALVAVLALLVLALVAGRPFLRWFATRYAVTDARVLVLQGIRSPRLTREMPLSRLTRAAYAQDSLLDRWVGSGSLVLESAPEGRRLVLHAVPDVALVLDDVHRLAQARHGRR